jgi:hypothetical protein
MQGEILSYFGEPSYYIMFLTKGNPFFADFRQKNRSPGGNVIKLSKFALTKKYPPQIFEVGIFICS